MSESQQNTTNQPQSANSPLLPDEQVLWEGDRKKSYKPFWVAALIQLVILAGLLLFFGDPARLAILIFVLVLILPINLLLLIDYFRAKSHYILTPERLIIQVDSSTKKAVNVDFAKILEVSLVQNSHNAYVKLISPDVHVPSSLHPTEKVRELYESLSLLCRFTRSTEETARLWRLYNPPWKPWLAYLVVSNSIFPLYVSIPIILNWSRAGMNIYFIVGQLLLVSLSNSYKLLLPLFLGKEYKANLRISPLHSQVGLAFRVMSIILAILLIIPFWNKMS